MCQPLPVPGTDARATDVIACLNEWNRHLSSKDCKAKYEAMAESPFAFYRGANHLFWSDLANDPRLAEFGKKAGTRTWLQGDLHTDNFGAFSSDKGVLVYDINDYDEAVIADYQYDLWRMAVSIVLVGREHELTKDEQGGACDSFAASYLRALSEYARAGGEAEAIFDQNTTNGALETFFHEVEEKNSRAAMLKKWTNGRARFKRNDKLKKVADSQYQAIVAGVQRYRQARVMRPEVDPEKFFVVHDVARRVNAGVGSLGVPRFYVLVAGDDDGPRILDVKLQSIPTAYQFLTGEDQAEYHRLTQDTRSYPGENARWHEAAYRAMAKGTDDRLGWLQLSDGFYSVRELSFFKETLDTGKLKKKSQLIQLAELWGRILATGHARALNAFNYEYPAPDRVFIHPRSRDEFKTVVAGLVDGRHDEFCALVCTVAFEYADQVEADRYSFRAAFRAD